MNHYKDNEYDFESWEDEHYYRENKDFEGLVNHCFNIYQERPNDIHAQYNLGEAYILNNEYNKAIELLKKSHNKHPGIIAFQHQILAALYGLGKDENDFDWKNFPKIIKLSTEILDRCYKYLKSKRKPRLVFELYNLFILEGYVRFTEDELLNSIKSDPRFIVTDDDIFGEITINRKVKTIS